MITVKNITDEEHKNELKEMIHSYYEDTIGCDWTKKIKNPKIREMINSSERYTREDIEKLYGDKKINNHIALGLYNEDTIVGFASVAIFSDNVGGIYQIYIKPEFRKEFVDDFKGSMDATVALKNSLESYFKNMGAKEVVMEAPHTVRFLLYLAEDMGFIPTKVYEDATSLHKRL